MSGNDVLTYNRLQCEQVLGVSQESFDWRFGDQYGLDLFTRDEPRLKYCPECMTIFFHSAIYQATALCYCPIHHVPLVDECLRCGRPICAEIAIRDNADLVGYCTCAGFPRELAQLTDMFKPLPVEAEQSLDRFCWMARRVASDPRCEQWLFDLAFHDDGDRTAYGLFAGAIGLPSSFCELFHLVPLRRRYRKVATPEDPHAPNASGEWRLPDPCMYSHKRTRDEMAARLERYYEHAAFDDYRMNSEGGPPVASRAGQLFRVKGPWTLSGSYACAEAYGRWEYLWNRHTYTLVNNSRMRGALELLAECIVGQHHAQYEVRRIKGEPVHLTAAALRWAIRKMAIAMLVHSYAWIAVWCEAVENGTLDMPDRRFNGVGFWCLPRVYYMPLLVGDGSCVMYLTSPDVNSRYFRDLIVWDCHYGELADIEQFLALFGGVTPPPVTPPGFTAPVWLANPGAKMRSRREWVPNQLSFDLPSKNPEQKIAWRG